MLLISPSQIFSKHTNIDGSVNIHLRSFDLDIVPPDAQDNAA